MNDTGTYECVATNKVGEVRKQFLLQTHGIQRIFIKYRFLLFIIFSVPPLIDLKNETKRIVILRNENLTLQCPAYGYPSAITRWSETNYSGHS